MNQSMMVGLATLRFWQLNVLENYHEKDDSTNTSKDFFQPLNYPSKHSASIVPWNSSLLLKLEHNISNVNITNTLTAHTLWMLRELPMFHHQHMFVHFASEFSHRKSFFALKILSRRHLREWKKIHFSLFQIIALFGCWSGDFIREARGNFL